MNIVPVRYVSRLYLYRKVFRLVLLLLFAVAILGPWTYTLDGVPPVEWNLCHEPYFLLTEDRCASPVSGLTVLPFWPVFFFPLASSLFLLVWGDSQIRTRVHRVFMIFVALLASGLSFLISPMDGIGVVPQLWGMWLYAAVAWVALAVELLIWRRPPKKPEPKPADGAQQRDLARAQQRPS